MTSGERGSLTTAATSDEQGHPVAPHRWQLPGASEGRLLFAQVREDSALDVAAVDPASRNHVVVVTSGGGTALTMLAAGAGRVTAVDVNATQNDIAELQAVAIAELGAERGVAYLGGRQMSGRERLHLHDEAVRLRLSPHARATWDRRRPDVARGVLQSGVTERFLRVLVWILTRAIVSRQAQCDLLACRHVDDQRRVIRYQWDTRRWRLFFSLLLNRRVCRKVYSPAFFEHVHDADFAALFRQAVEHGLAELAVTDNYFVHQLLEGEFRPGCVPPHLTAAAAGEISARMESLELIDGDLLGYLRSQPDDSVDALCLSNICEWLSEADVDALLREVVRVASPDTVLVIRNFVGWTEVPSSLRQDIVVDQRRSEEFSRRDRSLVQRRMVVARVRPT